MLGFGAEGPTRNVHCAYVFEAPRERSDREAYMPSIFEKAFVFFCFCSSRDNPVEIFSSKANNSEAIEGTLMGFRIRFNNFVRNILT